MTPVRTSTDVRTAWKRKFDNLLSRFTRSKRLHTRTPIIFEIPRNIRDGVDIDVVTRRACVGYVLYHLQLTAARYVTLTPVLNVRSFKQVYDI
jgi:hypothetical protein